MTIGAMENELEAQETHEILMLLNTVSQQVNKLADKMDDIDKRVLEIEKMAMRYKGGLMTILSLGALGGWIISNIDWIRSVLDPR